MITNEQQKQTTLIQIANLKASLSLPKNSQVNPKFQNAAKIQTQSLITELEKEIKDYDNRQK